MPASIDATYWQQHFWLAHDESVEVKLTITADHHTVAIMNAAEGHTEAICPAMCLPALASYIRKWLNRLCNQPVNFAPKLQLISSLPLAIWQNCQATADYPHQMFKEGKFHLFKHVEPMPWCQIANIAKVMVVAIYGYSCLNGHYTRNASRWWK